MAVKIEVDFSGALDYTKQFSTLVEAFEWVDKKVHAFCEPENWILPFEQWDEKFKHSSRVEVGASTLLGFTVVLEAPTPIPESQGTPSASEKS